MCNKDGVDVGELDGGLCGLLVKFFPSGGSELDALLGTKSLFGDNADTPFY